MVHSKLNEKEIKIGTIFSESSHYTLVSKTPDRRYKFKHLESNEEVILDDAYVVNLLQSADQYNEEIVVGKEDKQDGTLGIRSIWENIHSQQVFTVCYQKQSKKLSGRTLAHLRNEQLSLALKAIEEAQKSKKGVLDEACKQLKELQNNPILPILEGNERILRGYKVQFHSRDGKYDCLDMDLEKDNIRPVNINTIKWLIFNGIKYIVE